MEGEQNFEWNDSDGWKNFIAGIKAKAPNLSPSFDSTDGLRAAADPKDFVTKTYGSKEDIKNLLADSRYRIERDRINSLLIELHLDQASELLDRVQRTRERVSALRISYFQNLLDLWEFDELDQIHKKEIREGRYSKPAAEKRGQVRALELQQDALIAEKKILKEFLDWYAPLGDYAKHVDNARTMAAFVHYNRDDAPEMRIDHSEKMKFLHTNFKPIYEAEVRQRVNSLDAQIEGLNQSANATARRATAEGEMADYTEKAVSFQIERIEVERALYKRKLAETFTEGGALKYDEQIAPLLRSAEQDTLHALAKLAAVSDGMAAVYGYPDLFPADPSSNRRFDIDDCTQWARNAINWLRNLTAWDHPLSFSISLNDALGAEWKRDLQRGKWQVDFTKVPGASSLLQDWTHLRLRGVSAQVRAKGPPQTWPVTIRVPDQFVAPNKPKVRKPALQLGRVALNNSLREPEVVPAASALNANPVGVWEISMPARSTEGESRIDLQDVVVELLFMAQPKTST